MASVCVCPRRRIVPNEETEERSNNCAEVSRVVQSIADVDVIDAVAALKDDVLDCLQFAFPPAQLAIERDDDPDWVDVADEIKQPSNHWACNNRKLPRKS